MLCKAVGFPTPAKQIGLGTRHLGSREGYSEFLAGMSSGRKSAA